MYKFLISVCTFKESENIKNLITEIKKYHKDINILIIDDFSNDNIKEELEEFIKNKEIIFLQRKEKLGLGSAHKLSLIYATKNSYDFVLSLDADFSHQPKEINKLLKCVKKNSFVIGSRFINGSKLDYTGFRRIVSILGNKFATTLLRIPIREVTTYFRIYDVSLLSQIPFEKLNSQGYSMGVELVWFMQKLNAELIEVPIHFKDRKKGKSKLPKIQILVSIYHVFKLFICNIIGRTFSLNSNNFGKSKCGHCHEFIDKEKYANFICPICQR